MDLNKFSASQYKGQVQDAVRLAEAIRSHKDNPRDVSFADVIKEKYNISLESFLSDLGIDPLTDTIQNLITVPEMDVRWIIPEVFRTALLLGYRAAPIYPNIIAGEEQMRGLKQVMPNINMSDAAPRYVGEGETIPLGEVSYGSKEFRIYKIGRGIKLTDEVIFYASLNLVSIFMRDFGVKLGHATDVLAVDCIVNGEQVDGSEAADVVGVTDGATLTYKDLLRIWVRLGRMGRIPSVIISGETVALDVLDLTEFKTPVMGSPRENLVFKSPIPQNTDYYVHGNVAADQAIILDPSANIIKFNGWPLRVESERIVSNQTEAFYVTLQTGFAKLFTDGSLIVDRTSSDVTFIDEFDVDAYQDVSID